MNCQPQQIQDRGHSLELPPMSSPRLDNTTDRTKMRTGGATPAGASERANLSRVSMTTQNESISSDSFAIGSKFSIKRPLSLLSKQYPDNFPSIDLDIEAYVNRSIEERHRKAKEEGKVARPLNSYMLYRKAYQQVARLVLGNDQQQQASQFVGISWNMHESAETKMTFKTLSKIDNALHHKAFPDYRYKPVAGKKQKSSGPNSKKMSTSIERRACRRVGTKEAYSHGTAGKKLIRSGHVEELGQHQSGEGNVDIKWWTQGPPSFANPLMHHGGHYEQPFATNPRYFEHQYPDALDDASFSQIPTQPAQAAGSTHERLGVDECIEPLFLQAFEHINTTQNPAAYLDWQSQGPQVVHDFSPITPDINVGQAGDSRYEGQEEWPVHQHVDERQNAFAWHARSQQRSR